MLENALNLRATKIYDTIYDENGKEQHKLNGPATEEAQAKQRMIEDAFKDWIFKDRERRESLVALYNEKFNCIRPREYDGSHIQFFGMNPEIALRPHQRNAIAHILYGHNTLLAHVVGAGKTYEMVAAAMEKKRLGLCSKTLVAVPNHLTGQFASEALKLYPNANILVTTQRDFEKSNRKRFCAKIATGNYDIVVIGHSQFEKIPLSDARKAEFISKQIDELEMQLESMDNSDSRLTVKQLESKKKQLKTKLSNLLDAPKRDDVVTFEELGADSLMVDEAHNFKNLMTVTKMHNIAGISTTESQKASDLFMKCQYLDEITGARGVTFATGTPISNSMTELYTMQRYLQQYTLERNGLANFDSWAATFGETVTAIELAPEGTGYRTKTRFARFFNLPELMAMFKECADIQTADNLNIIVIGGSGSGKTRFYVKPNALQLIGSYLFLDPKGELTRTLGRIMETKGISVTVLDLVHFQGHYNPMAYLETDEDAIKLAFAIVNNTKPKDAPSGGDKFWDDSSVLLISALILYLMYEAPASEQNFSTLMYMILNCQVSENEMVENPLMMLFGELERRDPQHPAVLQFKSFMLGAKKTLQSILISAAANLYMFNSRKFAEMTSRDEMFLPRMGLEQRALFIVLPDNDTTFNFIATMLYTQLFDQLFRLADSTPEYNGALPVHVRLMMDEFANVALPKNFKNILAVCRSRNISCDIILQNIAQLKSLFKDDWEGIIGNCDTLLYLGGNEYGTYEYLSKILGKETERTKSQSIGKGSRGSSSDSLQTAGRELCMPDEIRRMRDDECLLLMRSEDPVIDRKYNLLKHPNVKYTPDAGGEPYVIPPDYMGDAVTITMGAVAAATAPEITEEMYEQLDYLEKHPEENYYENEENFSQYEQGD